MSTLVTDPELIARLNAPPRVPVRDPELLAQLNGRPSADLTGEYNTKLSAQEEPQYQAWRGKLPKSLQYEGDYDLRGAFKAGVKPSADAHFTDQFKKPNHPTFSDESQYAAFGNPGRWEGETFIPPARRVTDPDLLAQLNEQRAADADAERSREEFDKLPPWKQFGVGVAKTGTDLYYGAKGLVRDLSPQDQEAIRRMKQVHGGAGTAGRVVGELAGMAIPMGAAAKTVRVASRAAPLRLAAASRARGAAQAGADATALAGYEALKAPDEGETRRSNAMAGALASGAGSAVGSVLNKTTAGIRKTPEAQAMLDAGVRLTPGMAAAGRTVPTVEQAMTIVPGVSKKVRTMQSRALDDIADITATGIRGLTAEANRLTAEFAPMPTTMADRAGLPALIALLATLPHGAIPAYIAAKTLPSEAARRTILGETAGQQALQKIGQSRAARYARPSSFGVMTEDINQP